jgi:hypothetical protein
MADQISACSAKKCQDAFAQAEIAERRIAGGVAPLSQSWLGVTYATCRDSARARQKLDDLHSDSFPDGAD